MRRLGHQWPFFDAEKSHNTTCLLSVVEKST
jgi:hypothetical protein